MAKTSQPSPWRLFHLGFQFAGAALVLGFAGWFIDGKFGTQPWGALTGGTIGLVGGMYLFIKEALDANRQSSLALKQQQQDRESP